MCPGGGAARFHRDKHHDFVVLSMKLWLNASCKYPNMIMPPQLHHHLHLSMTWNPTGHIPRRRRVDLTLVLNLDTWRRNRCNNFGRRCLLRRDYINFNCAKYVGTMPIILSNLLSRLSHEHYGIYWINAILRWTLHLPTAS